MGRHVRRPWPDRQKGVEAAGSLDDPSGIFQRPARDLQTKRDKIDENGCAHPVADRCPDEFGVNSSEQLGARQVHRSGS